VTSLPILSYLAYILDVLAKLQKCFFLLRHGSLFVWLTFVDKRK
jgi:hypothetical protein